MPTMPAVVSAAGAAAPCSNVVEDLVGFLRVLSDGTILRSPGPVFCPSTFPGEHPSVEWKEAVYDKPKNLHVRMYKPSPASGGVGAGGGGKLPVLVYFHGGGFCLGSCTWANVHSFCLRLAADAGAVVLSAGYRLAPGGPSSTGSGNAPSTATATATDGGSPRPPTSAASHHLAVRAGSAAAAAPDDPVAIRGYVLLMPFFGGVSRTPSEAGCPAEVFLNLDLFDRFWQLSLPPGATRDHPMANPFGPDSPAMDGVELPPVLVVAGGLDMLRDRAVDYAERLSAMGKPVELAEFAGEHHGFFTLGPGSDAAGELIAAVARFVDVAAPPPK
uniref:Alpha/beta hydrolase fold-3 domain-containing protein n=1 Tax=Oryza rufipogon TaxID=4529 RepID=A0A0E0Q4D7_ORYRU